MEGTLHFVPAAVVLPSGLQADVISIRLPPVFRLDFWTPGFWIDHHRLKYRRQVQDLMDELGSVPAAGSLIIGGDFNVPPDDGALAPLRQRLGDTFLTAGCGWGNTGTNSDYSRPLVFSGSVSLTNPKRKRGQLASPPSLTLRVGVRP